MDCKSKGALSLKTKSYVFLEIIKDQMKRLEIHTSTLWETEREKFVTDLC